MYTRQSLLSGFFGQALYLIGKYAFLDGKKEGSNLRYGY
jgi:hypothetical protein